MSWSTLVTSITPASKLSPAEFADALHKGLGRAHLHLREWGDAGVEAELCHAYMHNLAYDLQCEGTRTAWLMELISCCRDPRTYHEALLQGFPATTDDRDVRQQSELLLALARGGNETARRLLYEKFDRQEFDDSGLIGSEIIFLDGTEGMLHVANRLGRRIRENSNHQEDNYLISHVCNEVVPAKVVAARLEEEAQSNPNIRAYIDNVIANSGRLCQEDSGATQPPLEPVTLSEFFEHVAFPGRQGFPGYAYRFARTATRADLEQILLRIQPHTPALALTRYLNVFTRATLPEVPEFLLPLASSEDAQLKRAASSALGNVRHPAVRKHALKLLHEGSVDALPLLKKNYETGDWQAIQATLPHSGDPYKIHLIVMRLRDLCEHNRTAGTVDCWLWIYENSPCALCRNHAVDGLKVLDLLPPAILAECRHDCLEWTRELVADMPLG